MMTTFSRSQTRASVPKFFLKTPNVPGPQTSCVMSTSTFTQTFSPGATWSRPLCRARIFSVIVIGEGISQAPVVVRDGNPGRRPGVKSAGFLLHHTDPG